MVIKSVCGCGLFLAISMFLSESVVAQTPADYSWNTSSSGNVASVAWTNDQISTFIKNIEKIVPEDVQVAVGDYAFIDMFGDGNLELLLTEDYSGRAFFKHVALIRRTTATFAKQEIETAGLNNLLGVSIDIDGDGKKELLLPTQLTPYISAALPEANWTAIYSSTGSVFVERTAAFSSYYMANILPILKMASDSAKSTNASSMSIALAQAEYDKALRVIAGPNSEVGIETSQSLATSTDANLRVWAAAIFGDIGTPNALASLSVLMGDTDPTVAIEARSAKEAALSNPHCSRITIVVNPRDALHTINLASRRPITVELQLPAKSPGLENAEHKKTITFGSAGTENSLIACEDDKKTICEFRTSLTSFRVGDGVASLRGKLRDGTCVQGATAIQVINRQPANGKGDDE